MSALKQEAINIIENIREDAMSQVVIYLKNIMSEQNDTPKSMKGLHVLQSFAGTLPENFNYKQKLEEMREEKYGRID